MTSNYKLKKQHGFNPFKNKLIQSIILHLSQRNAQKITEIEFQQYGIILDDKLNIKTQTDKKGAFICQNMEIHIQKSLQTESKKLIMFNQRQYCQKVFKQIYQSNEIKENYEQFIKDFFRKSNLNKKQKTNKLIIYLSNSRQFSQQLIIGHNQTQNKIPKSCNILNQVYKQMKSFKNEEIKTQIYFSVIGIKKQNELYDLLNDQYLQNQVTDIKSVPMIKIRKIGSQIDSVSAQNLTKQILTDENHFKSNIQKLNSIKNHIESFQNFNQNFLIGELYHFYEANQTYDIFNETVILKINQNLPTDRKYEDGFYERRMKQENASKISSLLMRIGLNIKLCRKNRSIMQVQAQSPKKLSKLQMHQSKILLYLSPIFCNRKTSYILVNQIDTQSTLDEVVRKFQLNRSFISQKKNASSSSQKMFLHLKHYLDNEKVLSVIKRLATKFTINLSDNQQVKREFHLSKGSYLSQKMYASNTYIQGISQNQTQLMKSKPFATQRVQKKSARNNKSLVLQKYSEKIKSKSYFSQTIVSAQRNYLKSVERQNRKYVKSIDQNEVQDQEQYYQKSVNKRTENFKFVEDNFLNSYKPQGIRISYRRKMVVKKQNNLNNFS